MSDKPLDVLDMERAHDSYESRIHYLLSDLARLRREPVQ